MTSSRDRILGNIRHRLRQAGVSGTVGVGLSEPSAALIPGRVRGPAPELVALFEAMAREALASVEHLADLSSIPARVARFIHERRLRRQLVLGPASRLGKLDWEAENLAVSRGVARRDDQMSLSLAFAGIAETGTVMLVSGAETSLNFLPDYHIVVIESSRLVARMEDAWDRLRDRFETLPRTVNFISGPSKTADVEQTVEYGAHGPRCLHVILVG